PAVPARTSRGSRIGKRTELRSSSNKGPQKWSYDRCRYNPVSLHSKVTKVPAESSFSFIMSDFSELCYLGEIEVTHLHPGNTHIEIFLYAGPLRPSHLFRRLQHFDQALIKPEVTNSVPELAVFDQERAVARHAREDLFVWIDLANIPEPGYKYTLFCGLNHLIHRFFIRRRGTFKDDVHRRVSDVVGKRKSVTCRSNCAELLRPL